MRRRKAEDLVPAIRAPVEPKRKRENPRLVHAELRVLVNDIAEWVQGDGSDAQRMALADGIRERWGRP